MPSGSGAAAVRALRSGSGVDHGGGDMTARRCDGEQEGEAQEPHLLEKRWARQVEQRFHHVAVLFAERRVRTIPEHEWMGQASFEAIGAAKNRTEARRRFAEAMNSLGAAVAGEPFMAAAGINLSRGYAELDEINRAMQDATRRILAAVAGWPTSPHNVVASEDMEQHATTPVPERCEVADVETIAGEGDGINEGSGGAGGGGKRPSISSSTVSSDGSEGEGAPEAAVVAAESVAQQSRRVGTVDAQSQRDEESEEQLATRIQQQRQQAEAKALFGQAAQPGGVSADASAAAPALGAPAPRKTKGSRPSRESYVVVAKRLQAAEALLEAAEAGGDKGAIESALTEIEVCEAQASLTKLSVPLTFSRFPLSVSFSC